MWIVSHCKGSAGAGELDDEDEEEDDHVDEEHDLVLLHGSDDAQHWDEEEEDTAEGDASNDGQTGDDTGDLAWKRCIVVTKKYFNIMASQSMLLEFRSKIEVIAWSS